MVQSRNFLGIIDVDKRAHLNLPVRRMNKKRRRNLVALEHILSGNQERRENVGWDRDIFDKGNGTLIAPQTVQRRHHAFGKTPIDVIVAAIDRGTAGKCQFLAGRYLVGQFSKPLPKTTGILVLTLDQ